MADGTQAIAAEFGETDEERRARLAAAAAAHARATREQVRELGPAPADPLRATEWLLRVTHIGIERMLAAPNIGELERWRQIGGLIDTAQRLTPRARLSRAESVVLGRHDGSAEGPQVEDVSDAATKQGIDPGSSGPPARRGRPRKRPLR